MKSKVLIPLLATLFSVAITAQALSLPPPNSVIIKAYRSYQEINLSQINLKVPTVIELPLTNQFLERLNFALLDKTSDSFEPYYFKQETLSNQFPLTISTTPNISGTNLMTDSNSQTYGEFALPESTQGQVQISLSSPSPITSSALNTLLPDHVALPNTIEIRAIIGGENKIVLASQRMDQNTSYFPQTTTSQWFISFTFGQPLRISELRLIQENAAKINSRTIRFLAQPAHQYRLYLDPDREVNPPVGEVANLANAQDIRKTTSEAIQKNPDYIIADVDGDGRPDIRDNCVTIANPDQEDVNQNNRGDLCDDFDQDGVANLTDNCPDLPNRNQADSDSDKKGDVCDQEESRLTERHTWVPWVGIGFAALVLVILLTLTLRSSNAVVEKDQNLS